jgi:hypothetical protein
MNIDPVNIDQNNIIIELNDAYGKIPLYLCIPN